LEIETITLYRPVGSKELKLIEESGFRAFPPRLPEQPIFYPVTNEEYAAQIARNWNAKHDEDKVGYVTKFKVNKSYLDAYEKKMVGDSLHESTGSRQKAWQNSIRISSVLLK
jgi:hypothetical protein